MSTESQQGGVELLRKCAHVLLALVFVLLAQWLTSYELAVCGLLLFALFLLIRLFRWSTTLHIVSRVTYGDLFFALGSSLSAMLVFPLSLSAFSFGMLSLGCADAAAAIIGTMWGRHEYRVWGERKTIEGSCAFFLVASGLGLLFGFSLPYAACIGFLLMSVESTAPRGSDNLLIPLVAGWLHIYLLF